MKKINKFLLAIPFLLYSLASLIFISPDMVGVRSQYHSSQLKRIIVRDGNIEKTDYVDSQGKLTIAADLGYAASVSIREGNVEIVKFYDDNREPINSYLGYYAILREIDQSGNIIRITYLDANDCPVMNAYGYATEMREYNNNKVTSVRYYDINNFPVCSKIYGYGKVNEYDEKGKLCKIVYVDNKNNPMITGQGYAILTRNYYDSDGSENGKVESEFYFDENDYPLALSLGQYGIHKEYNEIGQETIITYLDNKGNPIINKRGYSTVIRTYMVNNTIATERYYDIEGNPIALSEGQYGIAKGNGQTIYLNRDGKEIFNLKNMLYNHSKLVVYLAIIAVVFSVTIEKKWNYVLLIITVGSIVYLTLLFRDGGDGRVSFRLFQSYKRIIVDSEKRAQILKNIWLFIPLGAILYRFFPRRIILIIPIAFSILIEGTQFYAGIGFCEVDDIISNSLGGWIGFESAKLLTDIQWKKEGIQSRGCC